MPFRAIHVGWIGVLLCVLGIQSKGVAAESATVPVETVVDYIYAVLASDRTFYTVHVVERMQQRGVIQSSERWRSEPTLPLPAQFVQESSNLAELTGVKVRYRLIGLYPINKLSGPANEFEKKGLEAIMAEPNRSYKGFVTEGGERRFEALYADRAVSAACVTCHNTHPQSPKRDHKLNGVLGAVSISIPVP